MAVVCFTIFSLLRCFFMVKRTQKWDILKFFLMFTVVLGHFIDYHDTECDFARGIFLFIYSFHMPLFIFISGMFSKRTVNEKRWNKILGYLVVYFAAKIFIFLYYLIFKQVLYFRVFGETGLAWFMFALFAFGVITVAVRNYKPQAVLIISILLALFAGYDENVNSELVLSRIIVWFPFYYAGYCTDPKKLEKVSRSKWLKLLSVIIIAAAITVAITVPETYIVRPMFTAQHPYSALGEAADFGFLIRLACYAVTTLICAALIILTPDKLSKKSFIAKRGQYTLPVYLFHYIIMLLIYDTFDAHEYFSGEQEMYLLIPISLAVTLLLSNKYLNKFVQLIYNLPETARKKPKETENNPKEVVKL